MVVDGSGGTSEVVDLVDFHKDGLTDVMENEVEVLLLVKGTNRLHLS